MFLVSAPLLRCLGELGKAQAKPAGDRLVGQAGALALDLGVEDYAQRSAEPRQRPAPQMTLEALADRPARAGRAP